MLKNTAGQHVCAQMLATATGAALTADVTVKVIQDGGTYTDGAGTLTHKGGGCWDYAPTQAETNADHLAVQFNHATGIAQVVNVYPDVYAPTGACAADCTATAIATTTAGLFGLANLAGRVLLMTSGTCQGAAGFIASSAVDSGTVTITLQGTGLPGAPSEGDGFVIL